MTRAADLAGRVMIEDVRLWVVVGTLVTLAAVIVLFGRKR